MFSKKIARYNAVLYLAKFLHTYCALIAWPTLASTNKSKQRQNCLIMTIMSYDYYSGSLGADLVI
jgi:hypothetical protein